MTKAPTKAALAEALGISASMVSRLCKRGMPADDVEGALQWRAENIDMVRRKGHRFDEYFGHKPPAGRALRPRRPPLAAVKTKDPAGDAAVRAASRLFEISAALLEADKFELIRGDLQAAMLNVPVPRRHEVLLDSDVMDELLGEEWLSLSEGATTKGEGRGQRMSDVEADAMGRFWYAVACDDDAEYAKVMSEWK